MENQNVQNFTDKWLRTEIELNRRHEAILVKREALLARHKEILKKHELKTKRLKKEFDIAKERNENLTMEINAFEKKMYKKKQEDDTVSELDLCKARYWQMVKNELSSLRNSNSTTF